MLENPGISFCFYLYVYLMWLSFLNCISSGSFKLFFKNVVKFVLIKGKKQQLGSLTRYIVMIYFILGYVKWSTQPELKDICHCNT